MGFVIVQVSTWYQEIARIPFAYASWNDDILARECLNVDRIPVREYGLDAAMASKKERRIEKESTDKHRVYTYSYVEFDG